MEGPLKKIAHFIQICLQTWLPQAILVSDWLISKKSSPIKPLSQMNRYFVGSIYGMFSIKFAHFVPIRLQTWPPQAILVSDWPILKNLLLKPLGQINRNLVGSIYGRSSKKDCSFHPDPLTNMATTGNSCS